MLKKNDLVDLKITDVSNLGYGVAHYDGETIFVKNTVTDDNAKARIIKLCRGYSIAVPVTVDKPSRYRTENDCKAFPSCGGCVYRHIDYDYERELKRSYLRSCFLKEGIDIDVHEVAFTATEAYRNKVQYPVSRDKNGALFLGFYSEYSHRAVDSTGCRTEASCFVPVKNAVTRLINDLRYTAYDEQTGKGLLRHVFLRSNKSGKVHVCFVINGNGLPKQDNLVSGIISSCPCVTGISININTEKTNVILGRKSVTVWGEEKLIDTVCEKHFQINPHSFWQINRETAEALYNKGKELLKLKKGETLLDLYCGIGSIGISIADTDTRLVGIEIVPEAVQDAKQNAVANGFVNAEFYCCDASEGFRLCKEKYGSIDSLIVDPPRKGLSPCVIDNITESGVTKILYISCNPATLARDVALLCSNGYNCSAAYSFDMFPRTGHVETLVLLTIAD